MEIRLILTACIVNCGLIPAQSHMQAVSQTMTNTGKVNYGGETRGNVDAGAQLRNLFDSIAHNNPENSKKYQGILKEEQAKERQTFDAMKEDLRTAQVRNFLKKKNPHQKSEHKVAIKRRETDDDGPAQQDVEDQPEPEPEVHEPIINDPEKGEVWNHDPDSREPTPSTTPKTTLPPAEREFTLHFITIIKIEEAPSYVRQPGPDSKVCRFAELTRLALCKEALQEGFIKGQYRLSKTADMGRETVYRIQYGGLLSSNNNEETVSACRCPTYPPLFLQDGNEWDEIKILIQIVRKVPNVDDKIYAYRQEN